MLVRPRPPLYAGEYLWICTTDVSSIPLDDGASPMVYSPRRIQPQAQKQATRKRIHRLNLMNTAVVPAGAHAYLLGQLEEPAIHLRRPRRQCHLLHTLSSLLKLNRRLAGTLSTSGYTQINDTVAAIRLRTRHHDPYEEWAKRTRRDAFVCFLHL